MRFRIATLFTLIFALIFPTTLFAANPKAGATCSKAGLTQTYAGKKFTCIKSGKKLVWDKGTTIKVIPTPTPVSSSSTPTKFDEENIKVGDQCTSEYRGKTIINSKGAFVCKHDDISAYRWFVGEIQTTKETSTPTPVPLKIDWNQITSTDSGYKALFKSWNEFEINIPDEWKDMQDAYKQFSGGSGIFHLDKYFLGSERPKTELKINSISVETCKIPEVQNTTNNRGFPSEFESGRRKFIEERKFPGPKMKIQVVPIYAVDTAVPKNSPRDDYGRYLDFVTNWAEYSSDVPTSIQVQFPPKYLEFKGKVSSYPIYHENNDTNSDHQRFNRDVIAQVDSSIDFTGVDLVYIVAPAGTELLNLQQGVLGQMQTAEGTVKVGIVQYSYTLTNLNSIPKFNNFLVPYWWIHETYHGTFGLDDHYGDSTRGTIGLGGWSLMSGWGGDLSAWEKWLLGFYSDSQINCLAKDSTSITWLAPSSVRTSEKKMSIIYLSKHKAIIIESIRAAGLYYKIPKASQGVLVYEVDLEKVGHAQGLSLVLPTNRNPNIGAVPYGEATLRVGESVISNGQKITVLESGNFGDVVKVEKA
mgnify:CR=1 FL=1